MTFTEIIAASRYAASKGSRACLIPSSPALIFCCICEVFCVYLLWDIGQFGIRVRFMSTNSLAPLLSLSLSLSETSKELKRIPGRLFEVVLIVEEHVDRRRAEPASDDTR